MADQQQQWTCAPGSTLLVPSGPQGGHLFVIALGPLVVEGYGQHPQVLMANVTSIRDGIPHDAACVLQPGDHPFIEHPSYVSYRHVRLERVDHTERMVQTSVWKPHAPCDQLLIERIIAGVRASRMTPREFKQLVPE